MTSATTPLSGELHLHLDGSMRLATVEELAPELGIELPKDAAELKRLLLFSRGMSLTDCLSRFAFTVKFLQRAKDLERITVELIEDQVRGGVEFTEIRFAPFLHTSGGLSLDEVMESVCRAAKKAASQLRHNVGIIVCSLRNEDPARSLEMAKLAAAYERHGVCGFDLAGGGSPILPHLDAFRCAHDAGLGVTIHAGECEGPEQIELAVTRCFADRIGHATSIMSAPRLIDLLLEKNVAVEACLTSNLHTGAIDRIESHPLKSLIERGVMVTLNSDNLLLSATNLRSEWRIAEESFGLQEADFAHIRDSARRAAFI